VSGAWTLDVDAERIGTLWLDVPGEKVNTLSTAVMEELRGLLETAPANGKLKALIFVSRKEDCFIAGARIEEIGDITSETAAYDACRKGQDVLDRIARLPIPTAAAIDGVCLGGGLELALACRYRLASDHPKTRLGLPETRLGIIPGFGGTTRLPRLVGIQQALGIILKGGRMDPRRAHRIGLVDARVPKARLLREARRMVLSGRPARRFRPRGLVAKVLEGTGLGRSIMFKKARQGVMETTGGHYPAPLEAIRVMEDSRGKSLEAGLDVEAHAVAPLVVSAVSKNLIRLFFLAEGVKKKQVGGIGPKDVRKLERMGVLGAGIMGGGIAQLAADRGLSVRLKDIRDDALFQGLGEASRLFGKKVKRRRMKKREKSAAMGRISPTLEYDGFHTLDIVVEAVVEDLGVKRAVLKEVEEATRGRAIFATNTSSLPISKIASPAARPDRVVGMHFFNPVHRMPLVEIIRGEHTSDETAAAVFELARKMGKVPVLCGDGPGFLVNRLLMPYLNEAAYLLQAGASVQGIDAAMLSFGMPMGPARLLDEVGLDIAYHVGVFLETCFPDRMRGAPLLKSIRDAGLQGRKGGSGFFLYDRKGKQGAVNPKMKKLLPGAGPQPSPETLVERMVLPMVNEASRILAEGIVETPGDVDLGMIMGTGFAPFRGGLLRYADSQGITHIADRLTFWYDSEGDRFQPAEPLLERAKANRSFYDD